MQTFYTLVFGTLAFDAVLLFFLAWAYRSPRFATYRISMMQSMKVSRGARLFNVLSISVLSLIAVTGLTWVLYDYLYTEEPTSWGMIVVQTLGTLLLYDFAYYFLHRFMHIKRLMRFVHGVHHRARNPSAMESFYLHPVELLAGLLLLLAATWVVGPVHIYAFGVIFFIYSTLNILVHSGMDFRSPLLAPINFLTRKHHVHHMTDFGKNYSSLTPLPDLLFGTSG